MSNSTVPLDSPQVLYRDHHGWLQSWLRQKLGCAHQAADLAHDTFVRLLMSPRHTRLREPRAYLSTIARGLLIDHYRRRELERAYLDALASLPTSAAPSAQDRQIIFEALLQVDAMLDSLPSVARQAFLLSQLDGLTYVQIASELDVSLVTVKRHMLRAFRACLALA